ncbi:MAG: molecular chaperone [Pseudomonadales bacterium]|nr:molecular chaperone [Pseudomonadales bacterium]
MTEIPHNPLAADILAILRRHAGQPDAGPLGIHHLLIRLQEHPEFAAMDSNSELALFRKNFLLMNALYQLQESLWRGEGLVLEVAPLNLRLRSCRDCREQQHWVAGNDPMREYYLNWDNLHATTAEDVAALLRNFWQHLRQPERQARALAQLGLPPAASAAQIKQRYRELASRHHPDRSGDATRFMAVREAYEQLRCS